LIRAAHLSCWELVFVTLGPPQFSGFQACRADVHACPWMNLRTNNRCRLHGTMLSTGGSIAGADHQGARPVTIRAHSHSLAGRPNTTSCAMPSVSPSMPRGAGQHKLDAAIRSLPCNVPSARAFHKPSPCAISTCCPETPSYLLGTSHLP